MWMCRTVLCAVSLAMLAGGAAIAAEKREARKAPARTETLACRLGTEDRHARIAVVLVGGRTDSFAYYSKWKPRTCSIYLQRSRDPFSKWADNGNITTVNIEKGAFLIEHKKNGEYHFIFRDIDRERYCGMDGLINGSLTIKKGSDQCVLDGDIMVEGTPLGQAHARIETPEPAQGASDVRQAGLPTAAPQPATAGTKPAAQPPAAAPAPQPAVATSAPQPPAAAPAPQPPAAAAAPEPAPRTASAPAASGGNGNGDGEPTRAGDPAPAAPAATTTPATASAPAAKPAESSWNPFSAMFRSLATTRED